MLKRITCDNFKTQPVDFRAGLNVVLGSSGGSNAIGKSIFLLILDFVFGGDGYSKSAKDVFAHVGHHTIKFEFEFDGTPYFFSRSTNHPSVINRCDSKFNFIDEIKVPDYREWLFNEYKIQLDHISFDEIVERFFRIYGHGSHNEHKPLLGEHESMNTAVEYLMKLFGKFDDIQNLKTAEENYGIKPSSKTERSVSDITAEIAANDANIDGLKQRREKLSRQNEETNLRALGIDPVLADRLAEFKRELGKLNRQKNRLISQLNAVRNNMPDNDDVLRKDFSALLRFFPNADLDAFAGVEAFHEKINRFLRTDIEAEIAKLTPQIEYIDAEITTYEKQLTDSGDVQSLSQSILTQYAYVSHELEKLIGDNAALHNEVEQLTKRKDTEQLLANLRRKQEEALAEAQTKINAEMERINNIITGGDRTAPVLTLKQDKTFEFETPDDKSEGTAFKNLVVYDLTMLGLTPLPVLIHDSSIVKRIEDADFEQILVLYQESGKTGKQVFIAFDKADSYTPKTSEMLEDSTVLHLSVGNELFGISWSRTPPTSEATTTPETESVTETEQKLDSE
jgi:predicted  nucleic acid-binding Zn-ribbon protein